MRLQRLWMVAAASVLVAACEIPTDPPILEQRWVLPLQTVTLSQTELLPTGVSVAGNFYDVSISPLNSSETLGNLCPACAALQGMTVPSPAFNGNFNSQVLLPLDVNSAVVVSGSVDVTITNNLGFDPLGGGGTITMSVTGQGGAPVLGTLNLDGGAGATMPDASVNNYNIVLAAGTVTGQVETSIVVNHPGGETTTIDVANNVQVAANVTSLLVSSANVNVDGLTASLSNTALDVEDLESSITDNIQSGSAILDIANPFGVTFTGSVTVGPVTKNVAIPGGATSQVVIIYTADELRQFLGQPNVMMSGSGTIAGGPVDVAPADEISIDPSIDLVLHLGG